MKPETASVHAGTRVDSQTGGVNTPVYTSSAYDYRHQSEPVYPRLFNTANQQAVVAKLAALESAEDGVLFSSGMAAISSVFLTMLKAGDHVVLQDQIYGGTYAFVVNLLERTGIAYSFASPDLESLQAAVTPATRMIYVESPANPLLQVVDLQALAALGRELGIATVVDSTFASPVNQNPLRFGLDLVVHSGTKYLGGHSDLCCGVALGRKELTDRVRQTATYLGGSLDAQSCYLLERSLKTLHVRVQRQNDNALFLAEALARHPKIARVYYPGLPSHPSHEIAKAQMRGFGGMLSFELAADAASPEVFLDRLQLIQPALSLGGVETTLCVPAQTSHKGVPEAERMRQGISARTIRLSVGIEHGEDLLADLETAL